MRLLLLGLLLLGCSDSQNSSVGVNEKRGGRPPKGPVVDSVILRPASWNMMSGQVKKFCVVRQWPNGTADLYPVQDTIPACQEALAAYRMGL